MLSNCPQSQVRQQFHLPDLKTYESIDLAIMHKSYINEVFAHNLPKASQQLTEHRRLAHLGDVIMNAAVTDYLFEKFPQADQGILTQKSQPLKARKGALLYAQAVGLDRLCKLGAGICERDRRGDMFGEMFEALMGAIYLGSERDFALTCHWFQTECAGVIERQLEKYEVSVQH